MIYINTDGGARGNPGPAAIGVVVWDDNRTKIEEYHEYIGETTNNVAEYKGLIKGLELASQHGSDVHVCMDSELIIKQMKGEYRVKQPHLQELHKKVKELETKFNSIEYEHFRREDIYQKEADRLVNLAMDSRF